MGDQIGGEIALKADNVGNGDLNPRAEFRRKWLLPGIAGFKTKMEFLACADLAGTSNAKVTFGLRNKAKNKVELERTLVGEELGIDDRVKVDLSTSLSYPDKRSSGWTRSTTFGRSLSRRTSRSISTRLLSASTLTEHEASRADTPPPCGLRGVHIHIIARLFGEYVIRISGVLRSEILSEGRSIFCRPPIFHSGSHAR